MRNPSIYFEPYRIKADRSRSDFLQSAAQASQTKTTVQQDYTFAIETPLSQNNNFTTGLQPGDLTKYMALPWQSDFNECTTQPINITYTDWNNLSAGSDKDERLADEEKVWTTLWWPAHRPLQSFELVSVANGNAETNWTVWSRGIPQTNAGDLKMVSEWWRLGFIIRNPYLKPEVRCRPATATHQNISASRGHDRAATNAGHAMTDNPFIGRWAYRSLLNDPDLATAFNDLEFGSGTIVIEEAPPQTLRGTIGGRAGRCCFRAHASMARRCGFDSRAPASLPASNGSTTTKDIWCRTGRMACSSVPRSSARWSARFRTAPARPGPLRRPASSRRSTRCGGTELPTFDVVIAGAGPAGAAAARTLATLAPELRLAVVARAQTRRSCGEVLSPLVQPVLRQLGL